MKSLRTDGERRRYIAANPAARSVESVELLCREAARLTAARSSEAGQVVETARWLAAELDDDRARGLSLRARANLHLYSHDYHGAASCYEQALHHFERGGDEVGAAITRSIALGSLSHLGQYERALEWAAVARVVLERHGEPLRLARLEFNLGHVKARRDRFDEALEHFRAGHEGFKAHGEPRDVGWGLRNLAVCYQDLNDFDAADRTYAEAREYLREHGLTVAALEVEYNIAYLYYLRGQYTRAIRGFEAARLTCREEGDQHHEALCDLDQAEIYLELNLSTEAEELAGRATKGFSALGMEYEAAKGLTYRAIAVARRGKSDAAIEMLGQGRAIFARHQNRVWAAVVDLFEARLQADRGDTGEAQRLAMRAHESFATEHVPTRAAACEILLAQLANLEHEPKRARGHCRSALDRLAGLGTPALEFQAHLAAAQIEESAGDRAAALASYGRAERTLERLRGQLATDEMKIAFGHDKQDVYEGLVSLLLAGGAGPEKLEEVFTTIEKAKSRALSDLLAFHVGEMPPPSTIEPALATQLGELRERLNWHDRRLRDEELKGGEDRAPETIERLRAERRELEGRLQQSMRRLRIADPELSSVQEAGSVALETVSRSLPEGALLLEYYLARGIVYLCLVGRDHLDVRPVAEAAEVERLFRNFRFQLGKFRLGADYLEQFGPAVERATSVALTGLYDRLVAPIRAELDCEHLVIVPHGFLHHLPFHALDDGERFLIDEFSISYAPSASVFQLCQRRPGEPGEGTLVLGVPDKQAPLIADEARAVAEALPESRLFLGPEATREALVEHGHGRRVVHIATHGHFRSDNPMFSAISLGDARLSLFDLYDLRLEADLVVLSGCGTGLSEIEGGDELVGLARGLLHAGARSLVATLWDVNDKSTLKLMRSFYRHVLAAAGPAESLRRAQLELREEYPQPYYWAPFVMLGRLEGVSTAPGSESASPA